MANNAQRYIDIMNEAHRAIVSGYNQAMLNYQTQKTAFLKQLDLEEEEAAKTVFDEINNQIYNESNQEVEKKMDEIFEKTKEYMQEFIVKSFEGNPDSLSTIRKRLDQYKPRKETDAHAQLKSLSKSLKKDIEESLESNGINRLSLVKYLQEQGVMLGGKSDKALQDNLFGYLRRLIIQRYTKNEAVHNMNINLTSYKNSLKGYLQEEAIESALQNVLVKYGYSAKQTGSIASDANQQIIYDLIVGPIEIKNFDNEQLKGLVKQMDEAQNIITEGYSALPEDTFLGGIQSKPWINPTIGNPHYMDFGLHSDFIPTDDKKYYWHGGVSSLMSRMSDVIGRHNFLFATKSELSFTVDLLAQLRERRYVLNFHKAKNEAISNPRVYANIHHDE